MVNILYNITCMNGKSEAGIVICIFFIVTETTGKRINMKLNIVLSNDLMCLFILIYTDLLIFLV